MSRLTRAAIIAVGSELLTPSRLDTNSLFITSELNALGIDLLFKSVIGDDRAELTAAVESDKQRRIDLQATAQELALQSRQLAESLRDTEMQDLSLRKDEENLRQFLADLDVRLAGIDAEIQKGVADRQRFEQEARSAQAQLAQWTSEKTGQEAGLARVRERLAAIDQEGRAFQERVTEARLLSESLRAKQGHEQANRSRVVQQQTATEQRRQALLDHLENLTRDIQRSHDTGLDLFCQGPDKFFSFGVQVCKPEFRPRLVQRFGAPPGDGLVVGNADDKPLFSFE